MKLTDEQVSDFARAAVKDGKSGESAIRAAEAEVLRLNGLTGDGRGEESDAGFDRTASHNERRYICKAEINAFSGLHLIPQYTYHDDAEIIGTIEGQTALRDAIELAINDCASEVLTFTSDGEGYSLMIRKLTHSEFGEERPHYSCRVEDFLHTPPQQEQAAPAFGYFDEKTAIAAAKSQALLGVERNEHGAIGLCYAFMSLREKAAPGAMQDGFVMVPKEADERIKRAIFVMLASADDEGLFYRKLIQVAASPKVG